MNYIGLIFTFFLPGLLIGFLMFCTVCSIGIKARKRNRRACSARAIEHKKLYIWNIEKDCAHPQSTHLIKKPHTTAA